MNNDLLRQRRNLILISGALIIYDFAEISIAKISLLGTDLLVGKPEALFLAAWLLWFYFFLRYYQYLKAESNLGIGSSCKFFFDQYAKENAAKALTANKTIGGAGVLPNPEFEVYKESIFKWKLRKNLFPDEECHLLDLPFRYVSCWFLKSLIKLIILTPKVTDHVIPILIAISVPLIKFII